MNLISREELKAKLDAGENFKLVMALSEWAFRAKHIPGSIHIDRIDRASEFLSLADEIVIYCSDAACPSSKYAYLQLVAAGYRNIRRYEGGLSDWEEHHLPLEGEWATN